MLAGDFSVTQQEQEQQQDKRVLGVRITLNIYYIGDFKSSMLTLSYNTVHIPLNIALQCGDYTNKEQTQHNNSKTQFSFGVAFLGWRAITLFSIPTKVLFLSQKRYIEADC